MSSRGPQRVVWSEGLLIGPEHMQQLDAYHERLLARRLDAIENLLPEGPRPASFAVYVARANRPLLRLQVTEVHRT